MADLHLKQTPRGSGIHAGHEHIRPAVAIEIANRVALPEPVPRCADCAVEVGKFSMAVVGVMVESAKVGHVEQIQIAVAIEIHPRSAARAAQFAQGRRGGFREFSRAIIQQQA